MRAKVLALAAVLTAATPVFAQAASKAAEPDHTGPIPYSELASADAKLNAAPTRHKRHVAHHRAKAKAAPAASTGASTKTPSQ
jgi:hypothetical protein